MSDVTGVTGMRILRAIVAGERDPQTCAQSRDYRITSRPETMAKALAGDSRAEHRFTLTPSLALDDFPRRHITDCDQELGASSARCDPPRFCHPSLASPNDDASATATPRTGL
jgi:hypothetical protein